MILYTPLQFVNGPLASLPLKITAVQMSLVSAMHPVFFFMEDQWMIAEHAHKWFTPLR